MNTFYSDLVTKALPKSMTVENLEESKGVISIIEHTLMSAYCQTMLDLWKHY